MEPRRPTATSRSAAGLLPRYAAVVPGLEADGGPVSPVREPATGAVLAQVAETPAREVAHALATAALAQEEWAWAGGADRTRHLLAVVDALRADVRALAATEVLTTGRPVRLCLPEAEELAERAFSAAGWADKLAWTPLPPAPVGIVGVLADWRTAPSSLAVTVVAALACGNAVALRPRPAAAPLAHRLADAAERAGLPAGLLVLLPGAAAEGDAALGAGVAVVRAPGSAAELRALRTGLAAHETALSADPDVLGVDVVLAESAVAEAVPAVTGAALCAGATGRRAGSLVVAPARVLEPLLAGLSAAAGRLRVGDPLDAATDVGPCPTPEVAAAAAAVLAEPAGAPPAVPAGGGWWCPPRVRRLPGRRPLATPPGPLAGARPAESLADVAGLLTRCGAQAVVDVRLWGAGRAEALQLAQIGGVRSVSALPAGTAPERSGSSPGAPSPAAVLAQMADFRA